MKEIERIDIKSTNDTPLRALIIPMKSRLPHHNGFAEVDTIEFYDRRYKHTPDGQFIARYNLETLKASRDTGSGLDLQGDVKDWKLYPKMKEIVIDWADQVLHGFINNMLDLKQ